MLIKVIASLHSRLATRGAVASEYAVLLAIIAVAMVTAVTALRGAIVTAINSATTAIN